MKRFLRRDPAVMDPVVLILLRTLSGVVLILVVLQGLCVLLCREWVKGDLRRQVFRPVSVRWRPWSSNRRRCAFWVVYEDFLDRRHLATCRVPWHGGEVEWDLDAVGPTEPQRAEPP